MGCRERKVGEVGCPLPLETEHAAYLTFATYPLEIYYTMYNDTTTTVFYKLEAKLRQCLGKANRQT
jgi:hypothetical protein